MPQPFGQPFGKYELYDRIAAGGMAEIYRARYRAAAGVTKQVVIKKILPHYAGNSAFIKMFMDEAKIVVGLSHGNIAQVFDFGEIDGEYFLAMELVHGQALSKVIRRAREKQMPVIPTPFAVYVAMEMCKGLHYAHTRLDDRNRPLNIVHRDVSPQNVILSYDGQVKLVDFGIARARTAGRSETEAGAIKGKYVYFSPEQARGRDIDARTDVFATGIVLYEMLCGRLPFEGKLMDVLRKIVQCDFPRPRTVNPDLTPALERILLTAMAADKKDRYPTAQALQEALAAYLYTHAPTFSAAALAHLLGYLFEPELVAEGTPVQLPRDFLEQLPLWQKPLPPGPDAPGPSGSHDQVTTAGRASAKAKRKSGQTSRPKLEPRDGSGRGRSEVETRAAPGSEPRALDTKDAWAASSRPLLSGRAKWIAAAAVPIIAAAGAGALVFFIGSFGTFSIQLTSEPPGALVSVDGQAGRPTPVLISGLTANEEHLIEVSAPGWKTSSQRVKPVRGATVPLFVKLEPIAPPPQLDLGGEPPAPEPPEPTAPDSTVTAKQEAKAAPVEHELRYPTNAFEVKARHHTFLVPPSRAARVRLDPKKTYTIWAEGTVSLGGFVDLMRINEVFYFVEGTSALSADEAFGELSPGRKNARTIRHATALYAFIFDGRPFDNSGGTRIRIQERGEKRFTTLIVEPRANAVYPDLDQAIALHGLTVGDTYEVALREAATPAAIRSGRRGRATKLVFLQDTSQLFLRGHPLDDYARVVKVGSTFRVTATETMRFFFLDDSVEDNTGGVMVEVTPALGTGGNLSGIFR